MATQSLYRRYRPRRFSEVKGQDHVVRALRSVAEGREGQAYLFSGPRGTGKTSSARILAKVLNCEHPVDGEPCCECESCRRRTRCQLRPPRARRREQQRRRRIRDLIEKASLGTPGRTQGVHPRRGPHALARRPNALLKTLEEPPPHVVFVLATTDPQKMWPPSAAAPSTPVPPAARRHVWPPRSLGGRRRRPRRERGALEQALSRGGGSARDTLSALELVASTGDEGMEVLQLDEFVEAMIERDSGRALTVVAHDVATVQLTVDDVGGDTVALLQRIERLERQIAAGAVAASPEVKTPAPVDPSTGRAALGGRARATPAVTPPADRSEVPSAGEVAAVPAAPVAPAVEVRAPDRVVEATSENITAEVWENTIRPALRGMARAVYAPAGFVRSTSSTLTLSVPNAVHRAKCEEQRQVVEAALAEYVGSQVGVELLDGGGDGGRSGGGGGGPEADTHRSDEREAPDASRAPNRDADATVDAGGSERSSPRTRGLAAAKAIGDSPDSITEDPPVASVELPDDDDVDLDDLVDAPPESVKSPIDRLAEAFPGSELIEEAG
jgi:hypothetical protein